MRSFLSFMFVIVVSALAGCSDEKSSKVDVVDKEASEQLSSGMSRTCIKQERLSDKARMEKALKEDQERLASMGVLNVIQPVNGQLGLFKRVVADHRAPLPAFPRVDVDILAQLGIVIENQYDGEFGVTDLGIRGLADAAYAKLGILDEGMRGFTLSVRMADQGAVTSIDFKRKLAVIMIAPDQVRSAGQHELGHVLTGSVAGNPSVAHLAKEFIAIAGENDATYPALRREWTYDLQNPAILGMARTINGESGMIHANNVPLDGWRYDLLRLTDEKIGEAGQVALAKQIYEMAREQRALGMKDLRPLFEAAGLADIAVLKETLDTGLYVDLVFMKDGTPVVLAKTVDVDGYEGMATTSFQVVWRDADGKSIAMGAPQPMQPTTVLADAGQIAAQSSALEVRIGGQPYLFTFGPTSVSNATASGTLPKSDSYTK